MSDSILIKKLEHYKNVGQGEMLKNNQLLDEAIATLESFFEYQDEEELLHKSRVSAISYLALKQCKKQQQQVQQLLEEAEKEYEEWKKEFMDANNDGVIRNSYYQIKFYEGQKEAYKKIQIKEKSNGKDKRNN